MEAKNALENYLYSVKNTLNDDKWKDKIKEEEKTSVNATLETVTKWFESNPEASVEEFEAK